MSFELLINNRSRVARRKSYRIVEFRAARVEISLTLLTLADGITKTNNFVDQMVDNVQGIDLGYVTNSLNRNVDSLKRKMYSIFLEHLELLTCNRSFILFSCMLTSSWSASERFVSRSVFLSISIRVSKRSRWS